MLKNLTDDQLMKGGHYYDKGDINRVKNVVAETMILLFAAWLADEYKLENEKLAAECKRFESWYSAIEKDKILVIQKVKDILKESCDLTIEFVE